jgi:hypothetical protein
LSDRGGFVRVKLGKQYGEIEAGEEIWVDPLRAAWLRSNGYEGGPVSPAPIIPPQPIEIPERDPESWTDWTDLEEGDLLPDAEGVEV